METVVNRNHIEVNKWCGSCQHKDVDNEGIRICQLMQLKVAQAFVCPKWQMSDGLNNAGMSGGVVKKLTETFLR